MSYAARRADSRSAAAEQAIEGGVDTSVTTTERWRMSAMDLAEAIRSRQASSQEVIEAHLRRIEDVNASINAATVVLGEQAMEAAKAADRASLAAISRRCTAPRSPSRRTSKRYSLSPVT